ncbi:cuticle protein 16.8 [Trichonephila clavipes]|nr:cuticle protein 16.8 [Trichonephila clavipes]
MIVQFRNEKDSNHGSILITIDCNVVAFIVFEEGFHQPIQRTKQSVFLDITPIHHHAPQPYKFGYSIKDHHGEKHREESGDGGHAVRGSYGFTDARGIRRQVHYVADHGGFRAEVKTNEPGTANQNPAAVHLISDAPYAHGGYAGAAGLGYGGLGYASFGGLGYAGYGGLGYTGNGGYGLGYGGNGLGILGGLGYARYGF